MSLMKKEPSPGQIKANQANSLLSTGPRTVQGKATASRNALKPRGLSALVTLSLAELGEDGEDFERGLKALLEAMRPRDAWESAWIQDIAVLRWRLDRLHRAEAGILAMRQRHFHTERRRTALSPTGSAGLGVTSMISLVGFAGVADSVMKFQQVVDYLRQLRGVVRAEAFEDDSSAHIRMIYGKKASPQGVLLQVQFQKIAQAFKEGRGKDTQEDRKALLADLNREIDNYEAMAAAYSAEHLADDPLRQHAELLLPGDELDQIIRYETHLENQVERKLRQFYARRRESTVVEAQADPAVVADEESSDSACPAGEI